MSFPGAQFPDLLQLSSRSEIHIKQIREMAEVLGFEGRNRYVVEDAQGIRLGFVAEESRSFLGMLARQFFGHWRRFNLNLFNANQQLVSVATHPFRWFFQRLEVADSEGRSLGALQQRWSWTSRTFEILDTQGHLLATVESPWLKIWTFHVFTRGQEVAVIEKKWSGLLQETFLDADNFRIRFHAPTLNGRDRLLILMSGVFVDLQYFEKKASR